MIQLDLIAYLKSDATLDGLLGSSSSDSKIYPDQVAEGKSAAPPYIIYAVASDLRRNEVLKEVTINFNCVAESHLAARALRNRLLQLLDHDDRVSISSSTYYIYSCRLSGGTSFVDTEVGYFHNVASFTIIYEQKVWT